MIVGMLWRRRKTVNVRETRLIEHLNQACFRGIESEIVKALVSEGCLIDERHDWLSPVQYDSLYE